MDSRRQHLSQSLSHTIKRVFEEKLLRKNFQLESRELSSAYEVQGAAAWEPEVAWVVYDIENELMKRCDNFVNL